MWQLLWLIALAICGIFTLLLGTAHFFFPILLDFRQSIPKEGTAIKPFKLGPIHYATKRSDVHGIGWVMNHAASYTLVSIGIVDLLAFAWLGTTTGQVLAIWITGWWLLRAGTQLYLGKRAGDFRILFGFAWLGLVHLAVVLWG